MLTYERAADGESVACGGGSEWTHEGDLKGMTSSEYGRRRVNFVNK